MTINDNGYPATPGLEATAKRLTAGMDAGTGKTPSETYANCCDDKIIQITGCGPMTFFWSVRSANDCGTRHGPVTSPEKAFENALAWVRGGTLD